MSTPENPPAFQNSGGKMTLSDSNLTMRDYFAAKAMQAIISTMKLNIYDTQPNENDALIAQRAGRIADTMLAERSKK